MEKIHEITLRLSSAATIAPLFSVVQGDANTRKIRATILNDDGTDFAPESGVTSEFWSQKPDGTGTQHSTSIESNVVTVVLTEQDLAAAGRVYATIVLKAADEVLSVMPFFFDVKPIPIGVDLASSNDYQMLIEAVDAAGHAPTIRSSDLHWMVWDADSGEYVDTGVPASGIDGSVLYSAAQTLTSAQKTQARSNIGGASAETLTQLDIDLKAGTLATADYHLGFYLDSEGYLCQA